MVLRVVQIEELQVVLSRSTHLIDLYEGRRPGFVEAVAEWLRETEDLLESNKIPVVGLVSSQRGVLAAASRGYVDHQIRQNNHRSKRRLVEAVAVRCVKETTSLVFESIADRIGQIAEAEKVGQQIVSIAILKQIVEGCQGESSHRARLICLREGVLQDPDLVPYWAALTGLLSAEDSLIMLDRAISRQGI